MNKAYISPECDVLQLSAERSMMLSVSTNSTGNETPDNFIGVGGENNGSYTGDLTRSQESSQDFWAD